MPWKETCAMDERLKMIADCLQGESSLTAISLAYGVSRKTLYKWLRRYQREGPRGLEESSRAPRHQAQGVSVEVEKAILALRKRYPSYGPKKIRAKLERKDPRRRWPAGSTIGAILKRRGLIISRSRKARACPGPSRLTAQDEANRVWSVDFKGDFYTGDGVRCYPLTVTDGCSRYLLACQGLTETSGGIVRAVMERLFREYGLPEVIRSDNGPPFASTGIAGLTRLSAWWIQLGIVPERIQPGKPQQNGRHERLHRTLKEETLLPVARSFREQQERFDRFRREYNEERPHEALGQHPPAEFYQASPRRYGGKAPEWAYPKSMETRRVKTHGEIGWRNRRWYVSEALAGQWVGLEEIEESRWRLCLGEVILGVLDTEKTKIERATGFARREEE